jgi:anti-sigma B factor antagonist
MERRDLLMSRVARKELLEIEIRRAPPHALVMIAGELDTSNVSQLYQHLAELAREGICHVALNLAELEFIDSTGISAFVAAHKRTIERGGELILFSPRPPVRRTFEVAGVEAFLNIRPSRHERCDADVARIGRPAAFPQLASAVGGGSDP